MTSPTTLPQLVRLAHPPPPTAAGRRSARAARAARAPSSGAVARTEAPNVYLLTFDERCTNLLLALHALTSSLKAPSGGAGGKSSELIARKRCISLPHIRWRFHAEHPTWKSDIRWVSSADEVTMRGLFLSLFQQLGVAERCRSLRLGDMVMYSGFFVCRRNTLKSHFHRDFGEGSRAFTLMTPLQCMDEISDCHLLCRVPTEGSASAKPTPEPPMALKQYRYKLGEAIIFGDDFEHATQTGEAPQQLAFLCFTFGDRNCTDEEFKAAEAYIAEQGPIYLDPRGLCRSKDLPTVT